MPQAVNSNQALYLWVRDFLQEILYALRDDAKLIVFDEVTGAEIGYIQFTPAETAPSSGTYWVGADEEGRIFVYFSDSEELIALKPQ